MSITDGIYIKSTNEAQKVAEDFCQHIFDDYQVKITETLGQKRATVSKGSFSIDTYPFRASDFLMQATMKDYGFAPDSEIAIFYGRAIRDIELLREIILKGVIGLIKTTDYSVALEFEYPARDMLIYHADELTLLGDPFWTEDRLVLFEDIPYKFKSPYIKGG